MKKRALSLILALALALSAAWFVLPLRASALDASGTCGDHLTWTLDNGVLTIRGTGNMYNYELYESPWYFSNNFETLLIKSVVIAPGVTCIGDYALYGLDYLTQVKISDSVTAIGQYALAYCSRLTDIEIPDSVTSIGESAFQCCKRLQTISLPDSISRLGSKAFSSCDQLTGITIPSGVNSIPYEAFSACKSLSNVTIQNGVTQIEDGAFLWCHSLKRIAIPNSVKRIFNRAFYACTSLEEIQIPASVTEIGISAFYSCDKLIIYCEQNSYAETYARDRDFPFLARSRSGVHFTRQAVYQQGQFYDVPAGKWYSDTIASVYELGLMKGKSSTVFSPGGEVTVAEAVTMAARLHSIYTTGAEEFREPTGKWYQSYLDYAYQNGIIDRIMYVSDVTRKATRAEFAEILARSLPDGALPAINTIADGHISDVPASAAFAPYVYKLYRAGILTGNDSKGTFSPQSYINRAEAATIVARMAESDNRIAFSLG